MKESRRRFFSLMAGAALSAKALANIVDAETISGAPPMGPFYGNVNEHRELILPNGLKKDSLIAITAPASPTSPGEIARTVSALKRIGYRIEIGNTITRRNTGEHRYFSGPDDERVAEFMQYIEREDVNCILCARGGYGIMRILPMIDFHKIRQFPKIIVGFSDITALLIAIEKLSGVASYHGPVAVSTFDSFTLDYFQKVLSTREIFQPIIIGGNDIKTVVDGYGKGRLVGGNLSMLVSTLGTPYEIDTTNSILFIEEVSEHPYKIDRMLTQLWLAGKFQQASGVALGAFQNLHSRRPFYPNRSFTIYEIISQIIKPLNIPCILGLPVGHIKGQITLPIGIEAEIDTKKGTFTILRTAVK